VDGMRGGRGATIRAAASLAVVALIVVSGAGLVGSARAAGCAPRRQTPCGSQVVVTVNIPVSEQGLSLALVSFQGVNYPNGSTLPPLTPGLYYNFSAVNIASNYSFGGWMVGEGNITQSGTTITQIAVGCVQIAGGCQGTTIGLSLNFSQPVGFSGEVFRAHSVTGFNASFVIPDIANYSTPGSVTRAGSTETVDWGIAIGGIDSTSTLVLGVNFTGVQTPTRFNVTTHLFWSTSIGSPGLQQALTIPSGRSLNVGDKVTVNISGTGQSCVYPLYYQLVLTDVTGGGWSVLTCSGNASATTGEWLAWDPYAGRGTLSPDFTQGLVSNVTLNGVAVSLSGSCSPVPQCYSVTPPPIRARQWIDAGGGWNESLSVAFPWIALGGGGGGSAPPGSVVPIVQSLANVVLAIMPYNVTNESNPFEILVDGTAYGNGQLLHLLGGSNHSVEESGSINLTGFKFFFDHWGSSAGKLEDGARRTTVLTVESPGTLEALMQAVDSTWAGYALATNPATTDEVSGEFTVPSTAWYTPNVSTSEVVGFWVGLGGFRGPAYGGLWQAGIQIAYPNSTSAVQIQPWYEYVGAHNSTPGPVFGPSNFTVTSGDVLSVSVWVFGTGNCSLAADSWSLIDLSRDPFGNPWVAGPHESWSGSLPGCAHPVDTATAEWIGEVPGGVDTAPYLAPYFQFSSLQVDLANVTLLGPYADMIGAYLGGNTLVPSVEYSSSAPSFTISVQSG
jgi:Peptidase A4 family